MITPIDKIAGIIRHIPDVMDNSIPVYIAHKPETESTLISIARDQSQAVMYGYGRLAMMYTSVSITIRDVDYDHMELLLSNIAFALLTSANCWIRGITPAIPVRVADLDCIEISMTIEMLDDLR